MHPVTTLMHWSHHMHDSMSYMRYGITEHLHSRHFWVGMGVALFIVALLILMAFVVWRVPIEMSESYPYMYPYLPYR